MEVPVDVPSVVEAPVVPVVEAPVVIESAAPVEVMDGGAKHKAKRRYSPRRKSASRRRSSSRSRKMRGGEFGVDAFGQRDLGQLPKKKNFPYSGATRNEDYDAINQYISEPSFTGAESAYEKLAKLHKQMMKASLSRYDATRLLEEVKAYDQTLNDGTLPQWIVEYAHGIDDKINQTEAALAVGDEKLAASYEWQAAIEEKKLAYMIMEALSGVAVGSGEDARSWRKDRTEGYTSPLGWETGFSGASASSGVQPFSDVKNEYLSRVLSANSMEKGLSSLVSERPLSPKENELARQDAQRTRLLLQGRAAQRQDSSLSDAEAAANEAQAAALFQGGKKHKKHGSRSRSRCSKGKVFDRDTKRCRNPKSKSKSRSRRMGGGRKCDW